MQRSAAFRRTQVQCCQCILLGCHTPTGTWVYAGLQVCATESMFVKRSRKWQEHALRQDTHARADVARIPTRMQYVVQSQRTEPPAGTSKCTFCR